MTLEGYAFLEYTLYMNKYMVQRRKIMYSKFREHVPVKTQWYFRN